MANLNLNKAILGGRLTNNVELKSTPSGVSVCQFTVAVTRKAKKEETDFINCVAWRKTAEFIAQYFHKGSSICVVGAIQTRNWTDDNGNKRYATEVVVDEANFVDSKSDNTQASAPTYTPDAYKTPAYEEMSGDDDLPF